MISVSLSCGTNSRSSPAGAFMLIIIRRRSVVWRPLLRRHVNVHSLFFFSSSHSAFQKSRPCLEGRDSSMNSNGFWMKFAEASRLNPCPLFRVREFYEFQWTLHESCRSPTNFFWTKSKECSKKRDSFANSVHVRIREAWSRNPKIVNASAKVDDNSTNPIENIDFATRVHFSGCEFYDF